MLDSQSPTLSRIGDQELTKKYAVLFLLQGFGKPQITYFLSSCILKSGYKEMICDLTLMLYIYIHPSHFMVSPATGELRNWGGTLRVDLASQIFNLFSKTEKHEWIPVWEIWASIKQPFFSHCKFLPRNKEWPDHHQPDLNTINGTMKLRDLWDFPGVIFWHCVNRN